MTFEGFKRRAIRFHEMLLHLCCGFQADRRIQVGFFVKENQCDLAAFQKRRHLIFDFAIKLGVFFRDLIRGQGSRGTRTKSGRCQRKEKGKIQTRF